MLARARQHVLAVPRVPLAASHALMRMHTPRYASGSYSVSQRAEPLKSRVLAAVSSVTAPTTAPSSADSVATGTRVSSSGALPGSSSNGGGGGDNNDFNTNFGEAVVVLREDLPEMFERDMRWHIFREDVTLTFGSMGGVQLTGLPKYVWLHRSVRALTWLLASDVRVTTLRMWESQTERRQLRVRWCVLAWPRLPSFLAGSEPMRFEAISTYKFDSRSGLIFEHSVDRLIPPESPVAWWVEAFIRWQGAPAQQPAGIPVPGGVPGGGGGWRDQL